jgi:hypothetical protein
MPRSNENINKELEELLSSNGFDVTARDSSGKEVPIPDSSDLFEFHFHRDGEDYGTVTVTIDGLKQMVVYYDDQIADSGEGDADGISWGSLLRRLKKFAHSNQLGFKLKDSDRVRQDMKRRQHTEKLAEGYYGNRKISYNDDTPTVKMIIKHNRALEETDQRFRHIERIFLETGDGERFCAPTNKPSRARMFARHIAEGGAYRDDRWQHLQEICEDLDALGGFVRATNRREQFNEGVGRMISEAIEKYSQLRETVKRLSTGRGYNKYFESYEPHIITETEDTLSQLFTHSTLDQRIERALPVLNKLGIRHREIQEAQIFETWAEDFLREALLPMTKRQEEELVKILNDKDLRVGPNGENAIGVLDDIIDSDDLNDELRAAAKQDSNNDAVAVIVSWMSRQNNPTYDEILDKLDVGDEASATSGEENKAEEPVKVKSKPAKETPPASAAPAADMSGLPPLPPLPGSGALPTLKEDDLASLKKLLRI